MNKEELEAALHTADNWEFNENKSEEDFGLFVQAARQYLKILPHIEKMMAARSKATEGGWINLELTKAGGWYSELHSQQKGHIAPFHYTGDDGMPRNLKKADENIDFITTAANEITAIAKILEQADD